MTKQSVVAHIEQLTELGLVTKERSRHYGGNTYHLNLDAIYGTVQKSLTDKQKITVQKFLTDKKKTVQKSLTDPEISVQKSLTDKPEQFKNFELKQFKNFDPILLSSESIKEEPLKNNNFDTFYLAYPRHIAKQSALKAWNKLKPTQPLLETILSAIEKQKRSPQWTKDDGQYIPHPATWLNQKRWEDEVQETEENDEPSYWKPYRPKEKERNK